MNIIDHRLKIHTSVKNPRCIVTHSPPDFLQPVYNADSHNFLHPFFICPHNVIISVRIHIHVPFFRIVQLYITKCPQRNSISRSIPTNFSCSVGPYL